MSAFRSRVRLVAAAWLLCQVTSLAAFVPEDCCAKHTAMAASKHHAEVETPDCHETAEAPPPEPEPGDDCPMKHGAGEDCPMHRSPTGDCCGISSACDGPNRSLARLFAFTAIIDAPVLSMTAPGSTPTPAAPVSPLLDRLALPDAPPPKS
jgi:hypothetical protein